MTVRTCCATLAVVGLFGMAPSATATFAGDNGRIAWSRDGDVFTSAPDGSRPRRLTRTTNHESAHWSPDGRTIAVVRWPSEAGRVRILSMGPRGSGKRLLTRARFSVQSLVWSPDGTRIAYCDLDISDPDSSFPYPSAIVVVDAVTGERERLTEFDDSSCSPSWSPDGSRIAFWRADRTVPDEYPVDTDIYVMDADGSNVQAVTDDGERQYEPAWSPTADRIAFQQPVASEDGQGDVAAVIYSIGVDGTGLTALTEPGAAWDGLPQWSPDGARLLYTRMETSGDYASYLRIVEADGNGDRLLVRAESGVWSPDSTKVLASRQGDLFAIGADGSDKTKVVGDRDRFDTGPSWQAR